MNLKIMLLCDLLSDLIHNGKKKKKKIECQQIVMTFTDKHVVYHFKQRGLQGMVFKFINLNVAIVF